MLDFDYPEELTLANPTGRYRDGEAEFETVAVRARLVRRGEFLAVALPPQQQCQLAFLIRSPVAPRAGAQLSYAGDRYELRAIHSCRDLEGRLECYRCEC